MNTPRRISGMDFIDISEHHSSTGRLNWTERKPKLMKYFFKDGYIEIDYYYFEIFNVINTFVSESELLSTPAGQHTNT